MHTKSTTDAAYKAAMRDMRKEGIFMSLRKTNYSNPNDFRHSEITGKMFNHKTI